MDMCENTTQIENISLEQDSPQVVSDFLAFKIRDVIERTYFPIFVPIGLVGNILSFMIMTQRHNRNRSISLYISILAVTDSITLLWGLVSYLAKQHDVIPKSDIYCAVRLPSKASASFTGTYLILSMTFERFYSIVRPHKASSFNTMKKAKITSVCILIFCILFNVPQAFLYERRGAACRPFANNMNTLGTFYYVLSVVVDFVFPFVALLTMNSIIIHKIRNRKSLIATNRNDTRAKAQSDSQIIAILLLVSFSFLILVTPTYVLFLLNFLVDFDNLSPKNDAAIRLFYSIAQKLNYTNNGINFFLYILSGTKFRNDFRRIFGCGKFEKTSASVSVGSSNEEGIKKENKATSISTIDIDVESG